MPTVCERRKKKLRHYMLAFSINTVENHRLLKGRDDEAHGALRKTYAALLGEFDRMLFDKDKTDFGCITPLYVYRMWGGNVAIDEIATGLTELRKQGFMVG